jgi:hypothetical protein
MTGESRSHDSLARLFQQENDLARRKSAYYLLPNFPYTSQTMKIALSLVELRA